MLIGNLAELNNTLPFLKSCMMCVIIIIIVYACSKYCINSALISCHSGKSSWLKLVWISCDTVESG